VPAPVATPTPQIVYVTVLVTPTPTVALAQDPIIGTWKYSASNGFEEIWRFNADGTFVMSFYTPDDMDTTVISGTWSSQGGNSYTTNTIAGFLFTFMYAPNQNAIYTTKYSSQLLTPYQGSVATASPTQSASSSSKTTSSSLKLSGNGDDTKSFSITGGGGFIVTGSNSGTSNFIVHITDSSGNVVEYLFNEIGPYSGKKIVKLGAGKYYLEVQAEGSWSIAISPS